MDHSPKFLALVESVRVHVNEISLTQLNDFTESYALIDVREDHEFQQGHLKAAKHLGRGIIERDIEALFVDFDTLLVLYCGGGYRSILAAYNLQLMGYNRVYSLIGGYKAGVEAGWDVPEFAP